MIWSKSSLYCILLAIIAICTALVCRPVDAKLTAMELDESDISTVLKIVLAHNGAKVAVAGKYYLIRFEATAKSRLPFDVPYVLVAPKVPRGDVRFFPLLGGDTAYSYIRRWSTSTIYTTYLVEIPPELGIKDAFCDAQFSLLSRRLMWFRPVLGNP